jgi:hypothetical protein
LKKTRKAAIVFGLVVFGLVVLACLLFPELSGVRTILVMVAVKLFALAIVLSLVGFLLWLIGPRVLYRRYMAGYFRLRRKRHSQHLREWREAAGRGSTEE